MKLPGASFLRERSAVRAFEEQDASFRELVFYSEGGSDWPHLGPVIIELLARHDRPISYLTSDPADPGLAIADPRFRAFHIGSGTARTILFARMDCRHFVMTLPDLGNLWLKRSVHPVHYIYLFHSMNSTHTSYRTGAFDQFDTILCVGPHHVNEIRATEAAYELPAKELVEHGSAKLDALLAEIGERGATPRRGEGSANGARRADMGRELVHRAAHWLGHDSRPPCRRLPHDRSAPPDDESSPARAPRWTTPRVREQPTLHARGGHECHGVLARLRRDDQRLVRGGHRVRVRTWSAGRLCRHIPRS